MGAKSELSDFAGKLLSEAIDTLYSLPIVAGYLFGEKGFNAHYWNKCGNNYVDLTLD